MCSLDLVSFFLCALETRSLGGFCHRSLFVRNYRSLFKKHVLFWLAGFWLHLCVLKNSLPGSETMVSMSRNVTVVLCIISFRGYKRGRLRPEDRMEQVWHELLYHGRNHAGYCACGTATWCVRDIRHLVFLQNMLLVPINLTCTQFSFLLSPLTCLLSPYAKWELWEGLSIYPFLLTRSQPGSGLLTQKGYGLRL